jgi:hypothetical protein
VVSQDEVRFVGPIPPSGVLHHRVTLPSPLAPL